MQTYDSEKINEVIRYALMAVAWSWLWWIPRVLATFEVIRLPQWADLLLGAVGALGPGLAAVWMLNRSGGQKSLADSFKQGWKLRFNPLLLVPALAIMPLIGAITGWVLSLTGIDDPWQYNLIALTGAPLAGTLAALAVSAAGQEIGWRGFLQPKLQSFLNPLRVSLVIGVIWTVWQLPLHFVYGAVQSVTPVLHLLLQTLALSILFTWLYNKTNGSTLVAVLFHFTIGASGVLFPVWAGVLARWVYFLLIVLSIVGLGVAVGFYNYRQRSQL